MLIAIVGVALTLLAAFLPWTNYDFGGVTPQGNARLALEDQGLTFNDDGAAVKHGVDGAGRLTVVLAVIAGGAALLRLIGRSRGTLGWIILATFGGFIAAIGVIDALDVESRPDYSVSIGIGLVLTMIGGVLIALGGLVDFRGPVESGQAAPIER